MAVGRCPSPCAGRRCIVATSEISVIEHPFDRTLDKLLQEDGFDEFAEGACAEFYAGNVSQRR